MSPLLLLLLPLAHAWEPPAGEELLPFPAEGVPAIQRGWARSPEGWVSSVRGRDGGGTRVGALILAEPGAVLALEAQGLDGGGHGGPWRPLQVIWHHDDGHQVLVADLGARWPRARLRLASLEGIRSIAWELRVPVGEPRGTPAPEPPGLSAALQAIGVVSRSAWGASATTCTSTEDDWYRMAIHHTAGTQTSGGTVEGAVRALQAYAMGSGEYCDIPYQFLVGYDGSLWEGRSLQYYSGATGGGNNDGNIALSFLGCYDPSCGSVGPHAATDAMMAWARLLTWTLADDHRFDVDADTVRGHRDWPGNATACPGEYVVDRFDELLSEGSYFQGALVGRSFTDPAQGSDVVGLGEQLTGWFELRNDGMETWQPGATFLAPLPRDQATALAGADWVSSTRAATVDATTPPGDVGRFTFSLAGSAAGTHTVSFGLVQEWVTWFADVPYGGGPADGALAVALQVTEPAGDTGAGPVDDTADDPVRPGDTDRWSAGDHVRLGTGGGCACDAGAAGSGGWLFLAGLPWIRRRRSGPAAPDRGRRRQEQ